MLQNFEKFLSLVTSNPPEILPIIFGKEKISKFPLLGKKTFFGKHQTIDRVLNNFEFFFIIYFFLLLPIYGYKQLSLAY